MGLGLDLALSLSGLDFAVGLTAPYRAANWTWVPNNQITEMGLYMDISPDSKQQARNWTRSALSGQDVADTGFRAVNRSLDVATLNRY